MNDLISRQAAIEKISETIWDTAVANDVKTTLKELPSAQPGQWISVQDRLPEKDGGALVCYGKAVFIARFVGGVWYENFLYQLPVKVSYWMPLPEPPEVEEQ